MHLSEELELTGERVSVATRFGKVTGGRALNGAVAFLELPYALPPQRFEDPKALPGKGYQYEDKAYIYESLYAVQPGNDGSEGNNDPRDKLGLGLPTENPLFLNVVAPPSFPGKKGFPVKIYIHGGYLQFGSPHSLSSQAQYVAAETEQVYVNVGYRLSVFGFLASDDPPIPGNFGFKDQWLSLEWVRDNISAFGGNPNDVQVTGLSAGAHSVHQMLHHVTLLPPGINAPFQRVNMQSNGIGIDLKTPSELRDQYKALLEVLGLDPADRASFSNLQDPSVTPWKTIVEKISTSLVAYGTFRGTSDGSFLPLSPSEMAWQASVTFAKTLKEKGVLSIVVGDLTDEWFLYSLAHPVNSLRDVAENLKRYYPDDIVEKLLDWYRSSPNAGKNTYARWLGDLLSIGQVHLPVRLLHRDLLKHGFPILRYEIRWTPPQIRPEGYVTHGTDRYLWTFRQDVLTDEQIPTVRAWLHAVEAATQQVEQTGARAVDEMLTLRENGEVEWTRDQRWLEIEHLAKVVEHEHATVEVPSGNVNCVLE